MKAFILLTVIAVAAAASLKDVIEDAVEDAIEEVIEYYTTGNDYLDIDGVIADEKEFKSYVDCFKDEGPCTDLATSYKVLIPESIEQACKRCNAPQKHLAKKFFSALKEKKPEDYEYFRNKFDPEHKYFEDFEKAVEKY